MRLKIGKIILALILLLCSGEIKAKEVDRIDVLAHYCAWYQIPWGEHPYTMPVRGFYNSWDPFVAAEQNEEKNKYGIGVDMISWPGELEGHHQEYMLSGYFRAYNLYTRKFSFLYEIIPLLGKRDCYDFSDQDLAQKFLSDIDYLVDTLFSWYGDYCYKINNKPVVFIWTGKFKNFEEVSRRAREKVYLVGPEFILFPPNDSEKERIEGLKCFDAITQYGIDPVWLAQKYGDNLNIEAVKHYIRAVIQWDRILKLYVPTTDLWLPVSFAYHDNRGDRDEYGRTRILTSSPEQAEMFAKTVRALLNYTGRRKVFVVSYNEHFEGTGVEESIQYGKLWLSLIQKYFTGGFTDDVRTNGKKDPWNLYPVNK